MKFNSKNFLIFLAVVVFIALAFFVVSSKKSLVNNSNNSEIKNNEISLEITAPKDGEILTKSPVSVTGTTVKGAEVFINDSETKADNDGDFKVSISLDEGENEIFVVVNDSEGNYAESSVKVSLNTE